MENSIQKVRLEPRISLNKLGEYLTANPSRRRTILHDQKYPSDFIVTRYNDAEKAITDYIVDQNTLVLDSALRELEQKTIATEWEAQTQALNREAIYSFYEIADQIQFDGCVLEKTVRTAVNSVVIENVTVSVRPEIHITKQTKDKTLSGAVKLYFSKTNSLANESGLYIASMLMKYLQCNRQNNMPHRKLACVIDVFGQTPHFAPATNIMRMRDITAACMEIGAMWAIL